MATRILPIQEVEARTALGKSTLYALVRAGQFPQPIKVGPARARTGWVESEVETWLTEQIQQSRAAPQKREAA